MTPDEHRAAAVRLLELADDYAADADWVAVTALSTMATAHAVLTDMLTTASIAGSGDGQAILAGRPTEGERTVHLVGPTPSSPTRCCGRRPQSLPADRHLFAHLPDQVTCMIRSTGEEYIDPVGSEEAPDA